MKTEADKIVTVEDLHEHRYFWLERLGETTSRYHGGIKRALKVVELMIEHVASVGPVPFDDALLAAAARLEREGLNAPQQQ